nr:signal peptidase I [Gloeothece citriformis]
MFFPGLGQVYGGKWGRGLIWISIELSLIIYGLIAIFSPKGNLLSGLICLLVSLGIYLINLLDAHLCIYYQYQDQKLEKIPRKHKNPWFAVFVSRVLPGLGQLYNQQSVIGLILLSASLIFLKLESFYSSLLVIPPTLAAIATYHAYIAFPYPKKKYHFSYRSIVAIMVGIIFGWGLIYNYIPQWIDQKIELFIIPSNSMEPTLQIGDRFFVSESQTYRPQRGDIVVFSPSETIKELDPEVAEFYVKRVIGKPWEKVQINNGIVYINDQPLKETYLAETANYQLDPVIIPPNHYFVLGDNRNNSFDSHVWGFLPREVIFGQGYKIYWPINRVRSLISD